MKVAVEREEPGRVVAQMWGGLQKAGLRHSLGLTSSRGLGVGVTPRQRPGKGCGDWGLNPKVLILLVC